MLYCGISDGVSSQPEEGNHDQRGNPGAAESGAGERAMDQRFPGDFCRTNENSKTFFWNGRPCQVEGVKRVPQINRAWGFYDRVTILYTDGNTPTLESIPAGRFNKGKEERKTGGGTKP